MIRYKPIPASFYAGTRSRLIARLLPDSCVIVYGNEEIPWSGDQFYPFRQNPDFFYLTGIDQENSVLLLCPSHPNTSMREVLFVKNVSEDKVIWFGEKLSLKQAAELSGIENVMFVENLEGAIHEAMVISTHVYVNLPEIPRFFTEVETHEMRKFRILQSRYPLHRFERLAPILRELRVVKEEEEVAQIKNSIDITASAFDKVMRTVRPGMMEYELEAEITAEFTRGGANLHAYAPIVAGGRNACILHYNTNHCMLNENDLVLMDFGSSYGNYAADLSRTIPVSGKFSPRQRQVYDAVLDTMKFARELMLPGSSIEKIQKEVVKFIGEKMTALGLFTKEEAEKSESPLYMKYYMHGIGHFMGIDVHDSGFRNTSLRKGMIITCEPGIYIKEEGIGIRIENDILISDKPVDLMSHIPIEASEIEAIMANR